MLGVTFKSYFKNNNIEAPSTGRTTGFIDFLGSSRFNTLVYLL